MKFTCSADILAHATIRYSIPDKAEELDPEERFFGRVFKEVGRELRFLYRYSRQDTATVNKRLARALQALARLMPRLPRQLTERFWSEEMNDAECHWFVISSLSDPACPDHAYFLAKLKTGLTNTPLPDELVSALKRSLSATIAIPIRQVIARVPPTSQHALLAVLCHRGELVTFAPDRGEEKSDSLMAAAINQNRNRLLNGNPASSKPID